MSTFPLQFGLRMCHTKLYNIRVLENSLNAEICTAERFPSSGQEKIKIRLKINPNKFPKKAKLKANRSQPIVWKTNQLQMFCSPVFILFLFLIASHILSGIYGSHIYSGYYCVGAGFLLLFHSFGRCICLFVQIQKKKKRYTHTEADARTIIHFIDQINICYTFR